jgi:hypothetical protein
MMDLQPQVEVKSFPVEPIKPLAGNHQGIYLAGGALSGDIYLWEVSLHIHAFHFFFLKSIAVKF